MHIEVNGPIGQMQVNDNGSQGAMVTNNSTQWADLTDALRHLGVL